MPAPAPAPHLSLSDRRRSLEAFTLHMGFRGFSETVAGPSTLVFVAFVLRLGIAKEDVGLIVALVSFAALAQLASFALTNRARSRKRTILAVALAEPLILLAGVLLVPGLPPGTRLAALAALACGSASALAITSPVKEDWLSAVIPPQLRGRYLGARLRLYGAVCLVVLLAAGQVIERWGGAEIGVLQGVLAAGCAAAVLSVLVLRRATMPQSVASAEVTLRSFGGVVRNAAFMRYVLSMLIYSAPFAIGVPYYQVFYLEALHLPKTTISYLYIGYWIVKLVGAPALGAVVDRIGSRRAALGSGVVYTAFFLVIALASADRVWMAVAAWTVVAVADSLYNIALPAALYRTVERSASRPAYFAVSSIASTGAQAVGGLLGVVAVTALRDVRVVVGALELGQFHVFYLGCALLMAVCTFGGRLLPGGGPPGRRSQRGVT